MIRHLIHVGYPKTGTTFLKLWFEAHPQIAFVHGGIAGCNSILDLARQSAAPDERIRCRVTSHEGLVTPNFDIGRPVAERRPDLRTEDEQAQRLVCNELASLFPNADVLLVTRGFRGLMLSSYSQYVREGGTRDFHLFRDVPDEEIRANAPRAWNFGFLVDLYSAAFGERFFCLPWELLRDDADRFVRELEARLGLDRCPAPRRRVNPSLSPVELRWYPRMTRTIDRLPVGERGRQVLRRLLVPRIGSRPLRPLVYLLQRLRPATPLTATLLEDVAIEGLRGRAGRLRDNPLYAPYARDYLF